MKKSLCIILVFILALFCFIPAFAESADISDNTSTILLRAGGGGSSGGGGGSGGGSGSHSGTGRPRSLLETILQIILYPFFLCSSAIVFHYQLSKRSRKAKKLMKQMLKSDNAWKFKNIQTTVEQSFYAIQTGWSNLDMSPASKYMSDELYDSFQTKLNWMEFRHEKNILKNIKLLHALPVAVHDDSDNTRDHVWFYIKGKMVDYIIDTDTQLKLSGTTAPSKFVEYWQFVRKDNDWVLNKILQKNESDQIAFSE